MGPLRLVVVPSPCPLSPGFEPLPQPAEPSNEGADAVRRFTMAARGATICDMRRAEALALLTAHRKEMARRFGVCSLALFGSVARDEARPDSDVDVLVEFDGPTTFDGHMGLLVYLEDLLGRRVDVVTKKGLKPLARPSVERDLVHVA